MVTKKAFFIFLLASNQFFADNAPDNDSSQSNNNASNVGIISQHAYSLLNPLDETLCEELFENAPQEVQDYVNLIRTIEAKEQSSHNKRSLTILPSKLLFVGKPGVGKTTLAQVVAQKLGRSAIIIRAPMVGNEYKNSESSNLVRIFEDILQVNQPSVLIIDEINVIAESRKDPDSGDIGGAATLWLLLDMCAQHKHILIIGTSNNATNLPQPLKDRFEGSVIELTEGDTQVRLKILNFYFSQYPHVCSNSYLLKLAQKTKRFSPRQLEALVIAAVQNQVVRDPNGYVTQDNVEKAYQKFTLSTKALQSKSSFNFKEWIKENSVIIQTVSCAVNLVLVVASFGLYKNIYNIRA